MMVNCTETVYNESRYSDYSSSSHTPYQHNYSHEEIDWNVDYSTLVDSRDSQTYKYASIGHTDWMIENLNFKGTSHSPIGYCYDEDSNQTNTLCDTYGRLYTWNELFPTNNSASVCPPDWQIPADDDWNFLSYISVYRLNGTVYGNSLDSNIAEILKADTELWQKDGNNTLGFTALPGGIRSSMGHYNYIDMNGYWWSATEFSDNNASAYSLNAHDSLFNSISFEKTVGVSVRCIQKNTAVISKEIIEFIDHRDQQAYTSVTVGDQVWMAENLNYSGHTEDSLKDFTIGYCYVDGGAKIDKEDHRDSEHCQTYGRLYNWYTTMDIDSNDIINTISQHDICPEGWHIPSIGDFEILEHTIENITFDYGKSGQKLLANVNWNSKPLPLDSDSIDIFGFGILPGGYSATVILPYPKIEVEKYDYLGTQAHFWLSDTIPEYSEFVKTAVFQATSNKFNFRNAQKELVRSVRCIKD